MNIANYIEILPGEEWRTVVGRPEYMVSSYGRVFSFKSKFKYNPKPAGLKKIGRHNLGYCLVNVGKCCYLHRVVAQAFLPNPNNLPEVNHIDNNKKNNHVSNLEWVTHHENIIKSFQSGFRKIPKGEDHRLFGKKLSEGIRMKMSDAKIGSKHPSFAGMYVINGIEYDSVSDAAAANGVSRTWVYLKCRRIKKDPNWSFRPVSDH